MPWNFCLFCKGEAEVGRENEPPSCKNSWVRELTAHGGGLEAGWTSGVLYRFRWAQSSAQVGLQERPLSDDRIKEVLGKSSLSTLIVTVWVSVSPLFDAATSLTFFLSSLLNSVNTESALKLSS